MGHNSSWYYADKHTTFNRGDIIKLNGTVYTSADGLTKSTTLNNVSKYFYSYYTNSNWTVLAPICYGNSKGTAYAYVKPDSIVSGGTLDTYTIKYNANGGSGAPSSQTKSYGVTLTLSSTKPTRTGYTFLGWSTSSSATSATYSAGGKYTDNKSVTLYAVWSPYKHTVAFDANGGSGAPSSQTKTYGSTLKLSTVIPTRAGYSFLGWGTSSSDTTVDYASGSNYTRDQNGGTYTLYAIWKANTYTVTFDANGGSGAPSSQTKTHEVDLILSTTKPTRANHKFLGWSTISNATSATYQSGGKYTDNKSATLYAVWEKNTYDVIYELDGGTNSSNNKTKVEYGTTLTLYNPTKTGYTFVGWHLNSLSGEIVTSISSSNTENITLYAEWKVNTYTITINPNGGVYKNSSSQTIVTANYGSTISLSTPTKEGGEFHGWTQTGLGTLSSNNSSFVVGDSNTTLIASWDLSIVTISYDANGGELGEFDSGYSPSSEDETSIGSPIGRGGQYCSVNYQYGDDISKYHIPTATKKGFTFLGWYEGNTKIESPYTVTQNLSLKAKWKKNESSYVYTEKNGLFNKSVPCVFTKDSNNLKAKSGFIYVFKNGKFILGTVRKEE